MSRVLPIAVLVSGEGTTLDALSEAIAGGHLSARVALVVSDRPYAPAIERARRRGLPTAVVPSHGVAETLWSSKLTRALQDCKAELIVLAGFLSILPPSWVAQWKGRVINVHPSLLPKYGGKGMFGMSVHEAVLAARERETGVTVHLVTDDVDRGPILTQETLPVFPGETATSLRERLRPVEARLLMETIRQFADGSWTLPYSHSEEPATPRESRETPG